MTVEQGMTGYRFELGGRMVLVTGPSSGLGVAFARASEYQEAAPRARSAAAARVVMRTDDAKAGPLAFVERRAPAWQGR